MADPEGKMGKKVVSKRSKGKVDFKRKEDPVRRPLDDENDEIEACDDSESEIEITMKKCKVTGICENIKK